MTRIDEPDLDEPTRASGGDDRFEPFDVGRLDNRSEGPRVLLNVVQGGVAAWGGLLAAGVFLFGGQDWRESVLVLGTFAAFLGVWRLAVVVSDRRRVFATPPDEDAERKPSRRRERPAETIAASEGETEPFAERQADRETRVESGEEETSSIADRGR